MSTDQSGDVDVEYTTNRIEKGAPGKLTLNIPHPEEFAPGMYVGEVEVQLTEGDLIPYRIKALWPITIIVPGRFLEDDCVQFVNAGDSRKLHVGQPATVSFKLHTFGCEPGEGKLTIKFTEFGGRPLPILSLPFPFTGIRDPVCDFPDESTVCRQWRNAPLYVDTAAAETNPSGDHQINMWTIHAGSCFKPGEKLEAEIEWPQSVDAPQGHRQLLSGSVDVPVTGGISVDPIGFVNKPIYLEVVSRQNLGASPSLVVLDPNDEGSSVALTARGIPASQTISGSVFHYYGKFHADKVGPWRLTWPDAIAGKAGDSANNAQIQVCGKTVSRLEYLPNEAGKRDLWPLRVFSGRIPILWGTLYGSLDEGRAYDQYRLNAFELGVDNRFARNVQFRPISITARQVENGEYRFSALEDIHLDVHVSLGEVTGADAAKGSLGPVSARPAGMPATESTFDKPIDLPVDKNMPFHIFCSLRDHEKPDMARKVKAGDFVYRGLLTGEDAEGKQIATVVEFPFRIEVIDSWDYDLPILIGSVVLFGLLIFLFVLWWKANYQGPKSVILAVSGSGGGLDPELQRELFGHGTPEPPADISNPTDAPASDETAPDELSGSSEPEVPDRPDRPKPDRDIMGDFM
ncbi:MAG: hypothetical protein ABGZ35_00945 [Planctomycetaceae bacterium]